MSNVLEILSNNEINERILNLRKQIKKAEEELLKRKEEIDQNIEKSEKKIRIKIKK